MATSIYSAPFWKSTGERAVKTVGQSALAIIPAVFIADSTGVIDFAGVPWAGIAGTAIFAGVVSIITSVVFGANGTGPSAIGSEIKADAVVLDEVELNSVEAQKVLDQMIVDGEVEDQEVPTDAPLEDDSEPEGLADDEDPVESTESIVSGVIEEDAEPEGPADDEEEVDLTPTTEGWTPRH